MAEGFVQFQKRDLSMLIVPVGAIISVVDRDGRVSVRLVGRGLAGALDGTEVIELADTMAMVAHKLGVPGGDLERGRVTMVHEHAAMKAGLQTIARMNRGREPVSMAISQAQETLERLGMGW